MTDNQQLRRLMAGRHSGPAAVLWHRRGCCRRRLLRVYRGPLGWHVLGDSFRLRPDDWLRRTGFTNPQGEPIDLAGHSATMEAHRAGEVYFANLRRVRGMKHWFPVLLDEWEPPTETFEVGCDHAITLVPVAVLLADCRRVVDGGRVVERDWPEVA